MSKFLDYDGLVEVWKLIRSKFVAKETGKALSTNDFTDTYKSKLDGIASAAEVNVQSNWSTTDSSDDSYIANKPTKLSQFSNDKDFVNHTVNNLTNYYLKSETYTKSEVASLISTLSSKLTVSIVTSLPTTDISTTTIYMLKASTTAANNYYDEYMNVDGTTAGWEKIGTTQTDLSDYYTKTQADSLLSGKLSTSTKYALSSTVGGAASSVTGTLTITLNGTTIGTYNGAGNKTMALTNTTYSVATTSAQGLMSAADKSKLDGIIAITTAEVDTICV